MSKAAPRRAVPSPRLLGEERRRRIVAWINEHGSATVSDLAQVFRVSTVTLRSDLQALERNGAIERSHGGALPVASAPISEAISEAPLSVKQARHHDEKVRIARLAAGMIRDGETIILDSGSTTFEIARLLPQLPLRELTVVTNALNIAMEFAAAAPPHIRVLMLGGVLRPLSHSMVGPDAEQTLSRLVADRLFLGADAIDLDLGVTTADPTEAQLNSRMVAIARQTVVLADASKFGRRSFSPIAPLQAVDCIVTDRMAPRELVAAFRERGIEVQLA